jgi:hypothetical protein
MQVDVLSPTLCYAKELCVLAKGPDVVIVRSSATNGEGGEDKGLDECLGFNP